MLRNKSQTLRTESYVLRNEIQIYRSDSQGFRNVLPILRSKSQILRSKSQALRNETLVLRNKSQILRSDHYTEELNKIVPSSNDDNVDVLDKINNKMDTINKINKRLAKIEIKAAEKVELIYEAMHELQDEIYSDDSWLRLVELEKIDAIIDEAFNVAWNMICGENRISPEEIKIDKHKDIDRYVSKLTDVINNKIELVNRMGGVIDHVMSEIKNETNMTDEKIHKVSEMDNDTLHLIDDKLNEIIIQSRKKLSKIVV